MAKVSRLVGSTSHILTLFIQDSTSTTGAGLTGIAYNTSGLTAYYKRNTGSASVAITLVDITTLGTFISGGFKAIDATNMPGCYEFHPPDAAYTSGAKTVAFFLKGAANMVVKPVEVELTGVDNQNATNFGLTNLDATVSSRLATSGYTAPLTSLGATAPAGWINTAAFASGATLPRVTLTDTVTTYTSNTPQTGDNYARLGAPTGASLAADVAAATTSVDGGSVSASPTPTSSTFTATGASLHAPTGGYTIKPQSVFWTTGANRGIATPIGSHTVSGSNHAFVVTALPNPVSSGDTFVIV